MVKQHGNSISIPTQSRPTVLSRNVKTRQTIERSLTIIFCWKDCLNKSQPTTSCATRLIIAKLGIVKMLCILREFAKYKVKTKIIFGVGLQRKEIYKCSSQYEIGVFAGVIYNTTLLCCVG